LWTKLVESASSIVVPIFRKYLEDHLSGEMPGIDLLTFVQDPEFCSAWVHKLVEPGFAAELVRRFDSQPQFCEAVSYIYERTRPTLRCMSNRFLHDKASDQLMTFSDLAHADLPNLKVFSNSIDACIQLEDTERLERVLYALAPVAWSVPETLEEPCMPEYGAKWARAWVREQSVRDIVNDLITEKTYLPVELEPGSVGEWYSACNVIHGDRLWEWMVSRQENGYTDLFHITHGANSELEDPLASCFSPETTIATETGPMPICSVVPGTRILTEAPSTYGVASNEAVVRETRTAAQHNTEKVLLLYAFNGEKPFVTAGHIFFTTSGAKALDPKIAHEENPGISV
jgi:hypothetical protein